MGKIFNEQDSLRIISNMISEARGNLQRGAGKYLILWGYIVFLASVLHFAAIMKDLQYGADMSNWIWLIATVIGAIITIVLIVKDRKQKLVSTYTDTITSSVWCAFGISAFTLAFLLSGKAGVYIYPAILFIYTFSLFISAKAYKFRWMYLPVVICITCVLSYKFIPFTYYPLPMAIAMLCGNIIPGHMLNKIAEKQNV